MGKHMFIPVFLKIKYLGENITSSFSYFATVRSMHVWSHILKKKVYTWVSHFFLKRSAMD